MRKIVSVTLPRSLAIVLVLLYVSSFVDATKTPIEKEEQRVHKYPPCAACRMLVNSFKMGMDRTIHEKFDGGDSAWEQDKLVSYATSETRLIEIQENLCKELNVGEAQCLALAEELEITLENWWFHHQESHPDVFDYLCIEQTSRCCPKNHFGPKCVPCPGYPDKICNRNGKCKGAGTRKGNGACNCDKGYKGLNCSECADGFYESYRDEYNFLCSKCHVACNGSCKGSGPKNCEKCGEGWYMVEGEGCFDIDECIKSDEFCPGNQFCINTDGGYSCILCDKSCNGCMGDGPDMCMTCAHGYHRKENLCINSDLPGRKRRENIARYATYLGLCIATCIIFQRNVYAASVIGLLVGVYISVSEYMINHSDVQDTKTNVDILGPA